VLKRPGEGISLLRVAGLDSSIGFSGVVLRVTGAYLAIGLVWFAVWRWTGNDRWIEEFFKIPGALLLVSLATIQLWFSLMVLREFSPEQPMRKAWTLIAYSAGFDLAGAICIQVLAIHSALNPLTSMAWWDGSTANSIRDFGVVLGGTCRFALLAAGLAWALRVYRRSRLLARLTALDWIVLSTVAIYMALEFHGVVKALRSGRQFTPAMVLEWPTDPLLLLLLAEALLLYRSVQQMGSGWIGRCWRAFSVAIFLTVAGDISIWATSWGYLPWPWSSLGWYIWLPAAAAFALAPVCQFEAIHYARSNRGGSSQTQPD
jgi:hypothetical protein